MASIGMSYRQVIESTALFEEIGRLKVELDLLSFLCGRRAGLNKEHRALGRDFASGAGAIRPSGGAATLLSISGALGSNSRRYRACFAHEAFGELGL